MVLGVRSCSCLLDVDVAERQVVGVDGVGHCIQYFTLPPHSIWIPHGMRDLVEFENKKNCLHLFYIYSSLQKW